MLLVVQADRFVKSGRALRRKMWWNNFKMKIVMGVAVVMVIVIIFLLICFGGGRSCVKHRGKDTGGNDSGSNGTAASPAPSAAPTPDSSSPPVTGRRLLMELVGYMQGMM
jgi:hypothetical protein